MEQKKKQKETGNSKQIDVLKKNFPQCFDKHGKFMPQKLNEIVQASDTEFSKESYSLNWLGKSYARLLANENPLTLLSEDKAHNEKPENINSQNLLIKGDNLEVLKHLQGAYSESIKMIYIDPPYNTGSDGFVYKDDRKFSVNELSKLAGIDKDEAKRVLDFTQSEANSHSAWLTFMYPRLYVAKELLKDDGVIFISIDDNEVAQLRVICNEVFGEVNFEGHIHWRRRHNQPNDKTKMIGLVAEHILVYTKNNIAYKKTGVGKLKLTGKFSNPDDDPKGDWATKPWKAGSDQGGTEYEVKTPTGKIYNEVWMGEESTFQKLLKDGRIIFPKKGKGAPRKKYYKFEREEEGQSATNWWTHDVFGHNQEANEVVAGLFGVKNIFSNPKSVLLIQSLISLANLQEKDVVLDFFAGSGSTAQAVMEFNKEGVDDLGFICVQVDELTDPKKAAYESGLKTIFDITKARIAKAAEKIKIEQPEYNGDLGFKIFETKSLFSGYTEKIEKLKGKQTKLFDGAALNDAQLEQLLTTWKVYDGVPLTKALIPVNLGKYTAYQYEKVLYLMSKGFATDGITDFFKKLDSTKGKDKGFEVEKLVLFGHNFESKHLKEIQDAVNQYKNRKQKVVSVVVRH